MKTGFIDIPPFKRLMTETLPQKRQKRTPDFVEQLPEKSTVSIAIYFWTQQEIALGRTRGFALTGISTEFRRGSL
jgi:hypothetical protein